MGLPITCSGGDAGGGVVSTTVYSDDFSTGNYVGGSGWLGPWIDEEASLPASNNGSIRIESGALRLYQAITGAGGIYRDFVVDKTDITEKTLTFRYRGNTGNDAAQDLLHVEFSNNGGASYSSIASIHYNSASYVTSPTYVLSGITGPATYRIRFRVESAVQTSEDYYIDDVTITVTGLS